MPRCPSPPPACAHPVHRHEFVCRAQSSYRETVASLRSEERGAGHVSARVHFWHGWQILMAFLGFCWRCDPFSLGLLVVGSRRRRLSDPRFPGAWTKEKRWPARESGCFCSAESIVQAGPPVHHRWPVDECKWRQPVMSIYVRSQSPQIIGFSPTWKRVSMLTNKKERRENKRKGESEKGRRYQMVDLS